MVPGARSSDRRLRIVFMGTPDYAVPSLEQLLAEHDVVAVFTQPDRPAGRGRRVAVPPVKLLAAAHGVPVHQPRSLRKDPGAVAELSALGADAVVVAAYGLILPAAALAAARHGCLNVHASLLPRWRGAAPVHRAILAGDDVTGATIMLLDEGVDTGPILARARIDIDPADTTGSLTPRIAAAGALLLRETLPAWVDGRVVPLRQDEAEATPAPRVAADEGRLAWEAPAEALQRRVRAMNPWPGAFAILPDGRRLKVHAATSLTTDAGQGLPGEVTVVDRDLVVAAASGALRLDVVQLEGRRAMSGAEFVRGYPDIAGRRLDGAAGEMP